jgi:hypothetical protein
MSYDDLFYKEEKKRNKPSAAPLGESASPGKAHEFQAHPASGIGTIWGRNALERQMRRLAGLLTVAVVEHRFKFSVDHDCQEDDETHSRDVHPGKGQDGEAD